MVAKLVLQTERLVSSSGYVGFTLQFTPTVIISEPNQVTFAIGHLSRDTEIAVEAVEEVGLLSTFAVCVDVVLIGETAYVPHIPYVRTEGFMLIIKCFE